jgi:uncharacterized protein YlxW (UPF0749 family)
MTADGKALPEFERDGYRVQLFAHESGPYAVTRPATEEDLTALRAVTTDAHLLEAASLAADNIRLQQSLADERAKVARLEKHRDEVRGLAAALQLTEPDALAFIADNGVENLIECRATLATVQAERDGLLATIKDREEEADTAWQRGYDTAMDERDE